MYLIIRAEEPEDVQAIAEVIEHAFGQRTEADLVNALRKTLNFIPELSLVAVIQGRIVGHILFYPTPIVASESTRTTLTLAPLAVHPDFQNKGIGSRLVEEGLRKAKELEFDSVIVLGYPEYYRRFGFRQASTWGLKLPFEASEDAFLAIELKEESLKNAQGVVHFPKEYLEGI